MVRKGQWVMLPQLAAKELQGPMLSPQGVKEEQERRTSWIGDYSYYNINEDTLPIATLSAIQYGRALDHLIREMVIVYPALAPIYVLKEDTSDGLYRIGLQPTEIPKLGLVTPSDGSREYLVAIHLNLPMGCKKPSPI